MPKQFINETFATSTANNRQFNAIYGNGMVYTESEISGI